MRKFALKLTKGDTQKILLVCDSEEAAMQEGVKILDTLRKTDGLLSVIQADFDENNNIVGGGYKLFHAWY